VLVGDWSKEAERKILLILDPLTALADCDEVALAELIEKVEFDTEGLSCLADRLAEDLPAIEPVGGGTVEQAMPLFKRKVCQPPARTWVLIGIATVRFGEIAGMVQKIADKRDVFCEVIANDG
jgi:hypothetical protein